MAPVSAVNRSGKVSKDELAETLVDFLDKPSDAKITRRSSVGYVHSLSPCPVVTRLNPDRTLQQRRVRTHTHLHHAALQWIRGSGVK